jgi:predicted amidophosphoribosyltransferase
MHVRYCPECDQEFRPHVERCSDCGGPLEDQFGDAEGAASEAAARPHGALPPGDYLPLLHRSSAAALEPYAAGLGQAAIPFKVEARPGYGGFDLKVRAEDGPQVAQLLADTLGEGPAHETADLAAGREGHCPACETPLSPGATECPECGLGLAQELPACGTCDGELDPGTGRCPRCDADPLP